MRLSYNTLCGKLFLTWLTLNETSYEKKILFSPHSWTRSGLLLAVCVCVCVCEFVSNILVLFSVRDCFHKTINYLVSSQSILLCSPNAIGKKVRIYSFPLDNANYSRN